jgi:hypothetical protein
MKLFIMQFSPADCHFSVLDPNIPLRTFCSKFLNILCLELAKKFTPLQNNMQLMECKMEGLLPIIFTTKAYGRRGNIGTNIFDSVLNGGGWLDLLPGPDTH